MSYPSNPKPSDDLSVLTMGDLLREIEKAAMVGPADDQTLFAPVVIESPDGNHIPVKVKGISEGDHGEPVFVLTW